MPQTGRALKIMVPYQTERRSFRVYRYHNNEPKEFEQIPPPLPDTEEFTDATFYEDDGYIALYANQFSTYAIGYSPIYVVTFDENGGEGNMTL